MQCFVWNTTHAMYMCARRLHPCAGSAAALACAGDSSNLGCGKGLLDAPNVKESFQRLRNPINNTTRGMVSVIFERFTLQAMTMDEEAI